MHEQIWSFETFAIAKTGTQAGKVYGGISWGIKIDKTGHVTSMGIEFLPNPTQEFNDAVSQWNTIIGVNQLGPFN